MYQPGEIVKIGQEIYRKSVVPHLTDADRGKRVIINVRTGQYMIDENTSGFDVVHKPEAEGPYYRHRVGYNAVHTFGGKLAPTKDL